MPSVISLKEPANEPVAHNYENKDKGKPYRTSIPEAAVTEKRKPYVPGPGSKLIDAGTPRANVAADEQHPTGTHKDDWAETHQHQTVFQQHCDYFDRDGDGIIWPIDTWRCFREWPGPLSFWPLALFGTYIIHFALSYPTVKGIMPDPFFRIWIENVHKNKHGSDSMAYDAEGRFRPQNFEDFFAKYDKHGKNGLTIWEVANALRGQAFAFDFFGCTAASLEWLATYLLLWPEDGVMKKDDVRRVYDGSIFYEKAGKKDTVHAKKI